MWLEVDNVGPELIENAKVILVGVWVFCIRGRDVVAQTLSHGQGFCLFIVDGEDVAHCGSNGLSVSFFCELLVVL